MRKLYKLTLLLTCLFGVSQSLSAQADYVPTVITNPVALCPGGSGSSFIIVIETGANGASTDISYSTSSPEITVPPLVTTIANGAFLAYIPVQIFASPMASGPYQVFVKFSHSMGMNPITVSINVNVTSQVITSVANLSGTDVVCPGGSITLLANTISGAPTSYVWYLNGNPIPMQTGTFLNVTSAGSYSVAGVSSCGVTGPQSAPRVITAGVTTNITGETCSMLPGNVEQVQLNVVGNNLTYQWRRNGVPITNGGDYTITNTPASTTLKVANATTNHLGAIFTCVVTGTCGSAFSAGCSVALPVTWAGFTAQRQANGSVDLRWETENETNNEGFHIERSVDGRTFETIGFVAGAGTRAEPQSYFYPDGEAARFTGTILYYRLRQVDFNGEWSYSVLVSVNPEASSQAFAVRPVHLQAGDWQYAVQSPRSESLRVVLSDAMGRTLDQRRVAVQLGSNEVFFAPPVELPAGIYFLFFQGEGLRHAEKVWWPGSEQ
ncbi:MAG: hypothetical protein H6555_12320 [Lewinellaceae bacterium]|nr:hypothetical protein [Lewinellaceae bacterium]